MHRFSLSFARIECRGCGARRIRGVACGTCGELPDEREVDPTRQRRQAAAQTALVALDGDYSAEPLALPTDVWNEMSKWPDAFFGAISDLTEGKADVGLVAVMKRLGQIKASSITARRLRPWLQLWNTHDALVTELESAARSYLKAFAAETPLAAQQAAQQAQGAFDRAAETLATFNELRERQQKVEAAETAEEAAAILVGQTFHSTGANNVLEFDAAGKVIYQRITGSYDCPSGMGATLQLSVAQVLPLIDEDNFWKVVSNAWAFLNQHRARFSEALKSPNWLSDFRDATARTHDVASVYGSALSNAQRGRHAARAMLDFIHGLVEGSAKRHLATLLSCVLRKRTYEGLRNRDAGGMLNTAGQQSLTHLLTGIDRTIRIAKAHEDWDVNGDSVTLRSGDSTVTMDMEELADKMLTALESVVAIQLAITIAAGQEGMGLEQLHPLEDLDVEWEAAVALSLAFAGWTNVEARQEEGVAEVSVTVPRKELDKEPLQVVTMAVPHIPSELSHARFELDVGSTQSRMIEGPLTPIRSWAAEQEGLQKDVLFWEAAHLWTVDGSPRLSRDHIRKCVANVASQSLGSPLGETMARLRILRDMAVRVDDGELAEVLKSMMGSVRNKDLDLPQAPEAQENLELLMKWQSMSVPSI